MKRNVLTIFLASPGDLQDERKTVRNTVERANKILSRRIGWHIELLGWEDTLPGYSRPQELINKDVDSCDLFIGVLWKRWGQDSGKFSSGFEEEFIRARDRRTKTGRPEIWLFFKAIDEELKIDPGYQLKKVLKFKDEQIKRKDLLFKDFDNSERWGEIIIDDLISFALDLTKNEPISGSQEQSIALDIAKENKSKTDTKVNKQKKSYPIELIDLFSEVSKNFKEGEKVSLDIWRGTRIYLQASIWFSQVHIGEVFDTHEINLVYIKRNDWILSEAEKWFLLRSFISDRYENRPGWFWLNNFSEKEIIGILLFLSIEDTNPDVRRGAIKLIADTCILINSDIYKKWLNIGDNEVVISAINIMRNSKNIKYLDLLDTFINHKNYQVSQTALFAKIELMYINKPEDAFSYLIKSGSKIPPLIERALEGMTLEVDKKYLIDAVTKANSSVRLFCARYLKKANWLSNEICMDLFKDPDPGVRKEGLLGFIELGNNIDMEFVRKIFPEHEKKVKNFGDLMQGVTSEEFLPFILKKRKAEELLQELDFFNTSSDTVYRALVLDHFPLMESRIRSDLEDEFESLRQNSESRLQNQYGDAAESIIKGFREEIIRFVKARFTAAALEGLIRNGKKEDVKFARKYICNTIFNIADKEAIELLSKFGDYTDVEKLLEVASKAYGPTKRLAVETAFKVSKKKSKILRELIEKNDSEISKIVIQILASSKIPKKFNMAKNLLNSKDEKIRLEALSILVKRYSSEKLEKLLSDYTSQQTYYYNVVSWIDRCLYSKGLFRKFFHEKLRSHLKNDQ